MTKYEIVLKEGKKYLKMETIGHNVTWTEYAMIYGWNDRPYIKRLHQKMYLTEAMLAGAVCAI